MADPFIGQIMPAGFNFAPSGWALCNGSRLLASQNRLLFAIIGTTYGGHQEPDDVIFNLPDLQGRVPIGVNASNAQLPLFFLGETGGSEAITLDTFQVDHTHQAMANNSANQTKPDGMVWGGDASGILPYFANQTTDRLMPEAISTAGGKGGVTQGHNNMSPMQAVNYIIALNGVWPARQ